MTLSANRPSWNFVRQISDFDQHNELQVRRIGLCSDFVRDLIKCVQTDIEFGRT